MLTCALRTQDKDLKIKFKNKYCIENINFEVLKVMNAQFARFSFLSCALRTQVKKTFFLNKYLLFVESLTSTLRVRVYSMTLQKIYCVKKSKDFFFRDFKK